MLLPQTLKKLVYELASCRCNGQEKEEEEEEREDQADEGECGYYSAG